MDQKPGQIKVKSGVSVSEIRYLKGLEIKTQKYGITSTTTWESLKLGTIVEETEGEKSKMVRLKDRWLKWKECEKEGEHRSLVFEKQNKVLGAKGGSWRSKKMEVTIYQSNISIIHKSMDLLIISLLNNNFK